jgi:hypothetical protein
MVHGLEEDLAGRVDVVRLNVADEVGQRAAERFATTRVPTIVLLDRYGAELYRTEGKLPRRQQILATVERADG